MAVVGLKLDGYADAAVSRAAQLRKEHLPITETQQREAFPVQHGCHDSTVTAKGAQPEKKAGGVSPAWAAPHPSQSTLTRRRNG